MPLAFALLLLAPGFDDFTAQAGLAGVSGDRFAFADFDGDGDPDLLVGGVRLFRNDKGVFHEMPDALRGSRGGSGCFADMDGDGLLDVVTLGGDLFLQGRKGGFTRVELAWPANQAAFGVADLDGDGLPDLFTGGGEVWKPDNTSDLYPRRFLRNLGGGKFRDDTESLGIARQVYGRSAISCDFDDDGDVDLFFGNYRLAANELWVNDGGRVTEQGEARGCRGVGREYEGQGPYFGHTIGASWADLDDDGWIDLWVSNLVHKFFGEYKGELDIRGRICDDSNLYRNSGPPGFTFADRRADSGIPLKPSGGQGVFRGDELWSNCACADADNDGDLDVFVTQVYTLPYSCSFLFRNEGGFRFAAEEFPVFDSYGGAWADVDGDGRLDLVTGGRLGGPDGDASVRLWRNVHEGGAWVAFRLPPGALGAVVRVVTPTRVMTRQVEPCMGSHTQQNDNLLHFGLGAEAVREVLVSWPDGAVQRISRSVPPGKIHKLDWKRAKRPPSPSLKVEGGRATIAPAAQAHAWDFDGDFRIDATTKEPAVTLPQGCDGTRLRALAFRGAWGVRAK